MATKSQDTEWLTREQIASVVDQMSASDLIGASGEDQKLSNAQRAGLAFDAAAARVGLSNGVPATQHIRARDFLFLAEAIGEVMGPGSPKADDGEDLQPSADTGE